MKTPTITDSPDAVAAGSSPATGSATRPLTLTMEEIRDLAGMCGFVVNDATAEEKEDERETEITITLWPASGIKDENGQPYGKAHKHIAYYEEYPEEGCVPLGSPNAELKHAEPKPPCAPDVTD